MRAAKAFRPARCVGTRAWCPAATVPNRAAQRCLAGPQRRLLLAPLRPGAPESGRAGLRRRRLHHLRCASEQGQMADLASVCCERAPPPESGRTGLGKKNKSTIQTRKTCEETLSLTVLVALLLLARLSLRPSAPTSKVSPSLFFRPPLLRDDPSPAAHTAIFILMRLCGLYPTISKSSYLSLSMSRSSVLILSVGNGRGSRVSCSLSGSTWFK